MERAGREGIGRIKRDLVGVWSEEGKGESVKSKKTSNQLEYEGDGLVKGKKAGMKGG